MLSVIEFISTEVKDNLNEKKKQEFSVWTNIQDDNQSINLILTDFISVWEGIININNKPESINDKWEIYKTKLLVAFRNNSTNFIYNYSPMNNDIQISILENFQGSRKVWLNKFKLFKKDESNSILNFHITISKQLKIQNEKYDHILQVSNNQEKDIENLRNNIQKHTLEKEEYTKKMFTKMAILLNSKKRYLKTNDDNDDESNHSSRNSKSDNDDDNEDDIKKQNPKKKQKIQNNDKKNSKNKSSSSSSSSSSIINNLKIVHDSKLSSLLASQTQSQDTTSQSYNKTKITDVPRGGAFSRFLQNDDDDDCFDFS